MPFFRVSRLGVPLVTVVALFTFHVNPVLGHLDLTWPEPRVSGTAGGNQLKTGPCGQSANGRTQQVTTFAPGQTISVQWTEYIDHPSYYRIAFDRDGDDGFPIRADMDSVDPEADDPSAVNPVGDVVLGYVYETPNLPSYSADVTLPDVECERCTLQVIQFMYDKVGDGADNEYYFQCADLVLSSAAPLDAGAPPVPSTSAPREESTGTGASCTITGARGRGTDAVVIGAGLGLWFVFRRSLAARKHGKLAASHSRQQPFVR